MDAPEGPELDIAFLNKLRPEDAMGFRNVTPTDFEDLLLMAGGIVIKQKLEKPS